MWFWSKFENEKNFLILFHSSRKGKDNIFTIEFDHFDGLSQFCSESKQTSKIGQFSISVRVLLCDFGQNSKMTKTSKFCSIHQENNCKSCLHSNLIILSEFHSFAADQDKLQT